MRLKQASPLTNDAYSCQGTRQKDGPHNQEAAGSHGGVVKQVSVLRDESGLDSRPRVHGKSGYKAVEYSWAQEHDRNGSPKYFPTRPVSRMGNHRGSNCQQSPKRARSVKGGPHKKDRKNPERVFSVPHSMGMALSSQKQGQE